MTSTDLPVSVITRIQKLLALAADGGATEAEATNAAEKAQYLMSLHNLEIATIQAYGGAAAPGSTRTTTGFTDRTVYKWRRSLMQKVAKLNFCHSSLNFKTERFDRPRVFDGYTLIGREANIASSRVMFDYLTQTIERLARTYADDNGLNMFERDAIYFRQGCSERLQDRLNQRYYQILADQEAKAHEADRANQSYSGSTLPTVVLRNYAQEEFELNLDMECGYPPGTTTAKRRDRVAKDVAMDAYQKEHSCSWSVAYDVLFGGITHAEAVARERASEARHATAVAKPETDKQRRKREDREQRQSDRSSERWHREDAHRHTPGYRAGHSAAADIGLDAQIDDRPQQRIK